MARGYAIRGGHQNTGRLSKRQKGEPKTDIDATGDTIMQEDREDEPAKLLFAMDYGTKTLSLAYRIAKDSDTPTQFDIYDVHFDPVEVFAPQVAAWTKDGAFIWGRVSVLKSSSRDFANLSIVCRYGVEEAHHRAG